MKNYLLISVGAIIGACSRFYLQHFFKHTFLHIWTINILGSFFAGFCYSILQKYLPNSFYQPLLLTGFLGSFTTFSAFSSSSFKLLNESVLKGSGFVVSQVLLSILAFYFGITLIKLLLNLVVKLN